jgi:hypothetical protein
MLTFELINKKRRPIKIYAISGIVVGLLLIILIGSFGNNINNSLKIVLMVISACGFVTGLFILSYSFKFKNVIGHISFSKEYIEIELLQKREIIGIENIRSVKFELVGYDGLNKTNILQGLYDLSYCSGINNFVYIQTNNETRKIEFYVSNQKDWIDLQMMVSYYRETFSSKNKLKPKRKM